MKRSDESLSAGAIATAILNLRCIASFGKQGIWLWGGEALATTLFTHSLIDKLIFDEDSLSKRRS
ncbi:MAG: hypothetical protein F6J95_009205 [Leptolyngbya sp. SIO1E4]|nr:hypothetical protein [Leptolyngbya sp. SIO1E4]